MKTKLITTVLMMGMLSGCSSSFFLTSNSTAVDDLYFNPDKQYVASASGNEAVSTDPRIAELQRRMNSKLEDTTAISDTVYVEEKDTNPYNNILVDSYDESLQRRLAARADLSFDYNSYNDALFYASAYDPSFYNVIIVGSHVWVEPRWIGSSWNFPHYAFSMGYGYGCGYGVFGGSMFGTWVPFGYPAYYDYYNLGYSGYFNTVRQINLANHYGARGGYPGGYESRNQNYGSRENNFSGVGRTRATDTKTVSSSSPSTGSTIYDDNGRGRRPATTTSGTVERRRPENTTTTVYTRPSTVNQTNNANGYTPTYNRPSGGLRQDYNTNRPASSGTTQSYERQPSTSNSNSNSYSRPASSGSESSYSRPATTSSGSGSSSSTSSGSSDGVRRR